MGVEKGFCEGGRKYNCLVTRVSVKKACRSCIKSVNYNMVNYCVEMSLYGPLSRRSEVSLLQEM